jgi:ribosome-associated protein
MPAGLPSRRPPDILFVAARMGPIRTASGLEIRDDELEERFVRSSGPGGQNVNKVATAVELRFEVARSGLPAAVKARLRAAAGHRMSAEGVLVIHARERRTQAANREAARARLRDLLEQASRRPKRRRPTEVPPAAREHRLRAKHRRGAVKQRRRRGDEDD